MNQKQQNNEVVGMGADAQGEPVKENDSHDYGKWALVATAIVLAAVAAVLWII